MTILNTLQIQDFARRFSENYKVVDKFGSNPTISSSSFEDVWFGGGNMVWQTTAEQVNVASTNVNDTAAGTGARSVFIEGLDQDYNIITETVTLNGTTDVLTTNSYLRINRAYTVGVGSLEENQGDITFTGDTSTDVFASIQSLHGQTQKAQYTVPAGFKISIYRWRTQCGRADDFEVEFRFRMQNESWRVAHTMYVYQNQAERLWDGGFILDEKSDINVRALAGTNNRPLNTYYNMVIFPKSNI